TISFRAEEPPPARSIAAIRDRSWCRAALAKAVFTTGCRAIRVQPMTFSSRFVPDMFYIDAMPGSSRRRLALQRQPRSAGVVAEHGGWIRIASAEVAA